ncbi:MAG TPA: S41 family peptidase [Desulfitobacteriaceae bacterium]|nr:S41 family peptidase [Desulfitobacteriaceae bacterium]
MRIKTLARLKVFLSILLILTMLVSSAGVTFAADDTLSEVRSLLQKYYVDPVAADVLNASSLDEMLRRLGDPHTFYLSAEEYQNFLDSIENKSFYGIGVLLDIAEQGFVIVSVIEGSPAGEAGLQSGDIITEADGQILAGLSLEKAASFIRGPEGSSVNLKIKRDNTILNITVVRQEIVDATVAGEKLDGQTGYIAIHSFGQITPATFTDIIQDLRAQGVKGWIIDLRNNPGGYLSTVLDLAGYFIGPNTAVQIKDRDNPVRPYRATDQDFVIDQPLIFLTNENSASASEILAATVQDWHKALLIGSRTYGKGTVQSIFNLADGGVLKMTVARFFSPQGKPIEGTGVLPDVLISDTESLAAARLLLSGLGNRDSRNENSDNSGYVQLTVNGYNYEVALSQARQPDFWRAWGELIERIPEAGSFHIGGLNGWSNLTAENRGKRWPLYYPGYSQVGELIDIPLDKKFRARFQGKTDWLTVNKDSVELIDSTTGERVPLDFLPLDENTVQIIAGLEGSSTSGKKLKPDTVYWLVFHQSIKNINGCSLREGALAVIRTAGSPLTFRSFMVQGEIPAREDMGQSDYGQAILDLSD